MNMEKAYNDQYDLMKQMVAELKIQNDHLAILNQNVSNIGLLVSLQGLGNALGAINGSALAKELEDEDEFEEEDLFGTPLFNDVDYGELYTEDVLAQAEEDTESLLNTPQLPYSWHGETYYHYLPDSQLNDISFNINEGKRTVVALLKDKSGKVVYRGVAKAHPNDIFYDEIGVVIALRRLFDLEIPDVYIQQYQD